MALAFIIRKKTASGSVTLTGQVRMAKTRAHNVSVPGEPCAPEPVTTTVDPSSWNVVVAGGLMSQELRRVWL